MDLSRDIGKAIATHEYWKHRLRVAIAVQRCEVPVETVSADRACTFGQWLYALPPEIRRSERWGRVAALHKVFHKVARETVAAALDGRMEEARHSLALGGDFAQVSALLIAALRRWKLAAQSGDAEESCGAEAAKRVAIG